MEKKRHDRVLEQLYTALERSDIKDAVVALRKEVGLPNEGLDIQKLVKNFKYRHLFSWRFDAKLEATKIDLLETGVKFILAKFGLGLYLNERLLNYVVLGETMPSEMTTFNPADIGAEMELDGSEFVAIHIYPEAKLNSVQSLIKKHWSDVQSQLTEISYKRDEQSANLQGKYWPDEELVEPDSKRTSFQPNVKTSRNRKRDADLFDLHRQKIIKSSGEINWQNAQTLLEKEGITVTNNDDIERDLVIMFGFPDTIEGRKKAIQRHRDKQK